MTSEMLQGKLDSIADRIRPRVESTLDERIPFRVVAVEHDNPDTNYSVSLTRGEIRLNAARIRGMSDRDVARMVAQAFLSSFVSAETPAGDVDRIVSDIVEPRRETARAAR